MNKDQRIKDLEKELNEARVWIKTYEYALAKEGKLRDGCYSDILKRRA